MRVLFGVVCECPLKGAGRFVVSAWFGCVACNGIKHTIKSAKSVKWKPIRCVLGWPAPLRIFTARVKTTAQITFINSNSLIIVEFDHSRSLTYILVRLGFAWCDQSSYTQNQSLQIAHISKYETPDDKEKKEIWKMSLEDGNQNGMPFILWNLLGLERAPATEKTVKES